jgi:opacity protein-like surface antigen
MGRCSGGFGLKRLFYFLAIMLIALPAAASDGLYLGASLMVDHYPGLGLLYMVPAGDLKVGYDFSYFALEGNIMEDSHDDKLFHYGQGSRGVQGTSTFSAEYIDAKVPITPSNQQKYYYALVGIGLCSLKGHDTVTLESAKYSGIVYDLGVGVERYISRHIAFNLAAIYRIVRFDKMESQGITTALSPRSSDDLITVEIGLNYHF